MCIIIIIIISVMLIMVKCIIISTDVEGTHGNRRRRPRKKGALASTTSCRVGLRGDADSKGHFSNTLFIYIYIYTHT